MKRSVALISRCMLAGVFLYAGGVKARDPGAFVIAIENYRLAPHSIAVALALYLPYLEITSALALLISRVRSRALACLTLLLVSFLAVLISARMRGLNIECGCFSNAADGHSIGTALALDAFLLLLCGVAAMDGKRSGTAPR
ncbi:MAG: hypothetical protein QOD99_1437 [Chthoniobacter sp.]|jgi:hypothetical protein|nr:hypothetical protein [Chthoniobacter sp.]